MEQTNTWLLVSDCVCLFGCVVVWPYVTVIAVVMSVMFNLLFCIFMSCLCM